MFAPHIGDLVEKMTTLAGSAAKPAEYRKRVLNRLIPIILPYEPDTWAAFSYANFNGRTFTDEVMGVQLSLMTNAALGTMCRSRRGLGSAEFPYYGEPNTGM